MWKTKDHNVSETGSVFCLPHTRRWIESKISPVALYNIHHRQNPFKSTKAAVFCFLLGCCSVYPGCTETGHLGVSLYSSKCWDCSHSATAWFTCTSADLNSSKIKPSLVKGHKFLPPPKKSTELCNSPLNRKIELQVSLSPAIISYHSKVFICILFWSWRRAGKAWEPSNNLTHFRLPNYRTTFFLFTNFLSLRLHLRSRDSSVGIATGYGLDEREVGVRVSVVSRIFSSARHPDWLWGPPNLVSNG
jgi:hypothetical protein